MLPVYFYGTALRPLYRDDDAGDSDDGGGDSDDGVTDTGIDGGQSINMNVVYSCKAKLVGGVVPGEAQDVRLYGINYDVSMGVS